MGSRGARFSTHQVSSMCEHDARSCGYTNMGRNNTSPSGERMKNGWDDQIRVCLCGGGTMAPGSWRRSRLGKYGLWGYSTEISHQEGGNWLLKIWD